MGGKSSKGSTGGGIEAIANAANNANPEVQAAGVLNEGIKSGTFKHQTSAIAIMFIVFIAAILIGFIAILITFYLVKRSKKSKKSKK